MVARFEFCSGARKVEGWGIGWKGSIEQSLKTNGSSELESERVLLLENVEGQLLRGERIWRNPGRQFEIL